MISFYAYSNELKIWTSNNVQEILKVYPLDIKLTNKFETQK